VHALLSDFRYALRGFLASPGFIGANTAIFSVVNAVLLRPLPYPQSDRLVVLSEVSKTKKPMAVSFPTFVDWGAQLHSVERVEGYRPYRITLTGTEVPSRLLVRMVTGGFFEMLGIKPALGRLIEPGDDQLDSPLVAVFSYETWESHFGKDPSLIGKTVQLDNRPATVVGILPPDFRFGDRKDELFVSLRGWAAPLPGFQDRANHQGLYGVARLKPGVGLETLDAEIKTLAAAIGKKYPATNTGLSARADSLYELWVGDVRTALLVLLGGVGFVLLIACANVANLLLARASVRQKEVAIRSALGAGRMRIVGQLLTESVLLSFVGGGLGLLIAYGAVDGLIKFVPGAIPRIENTRVDGNVLFFTLVIAVATGILFGLAPALQATRSGVAETLKSAGRSGAGAANRGRMRRALLVAEVALAVVLSVGAGLMIRSFIRVRGVDPGFRTGNLLTVAMQLNPNYRTDPARVAFYQEALEKLRKLPSVESASMVACLPIEGTCWLSYFSIPGRPVPKRADLPVSAFNSVGSDYFETMGVRLIAGRTFRESDVAAAPLVAVINESTAKKFFPSENPLGKQIKRGYPEGTIEPREIVGVVADVKQKGLDADQVTEIYFPHAQSTWAGMNFVIRTAVPPSSLIATVRQTLHGMDQQSPIFDMKPMDEVLDQSTASRSFSMTLLGIFAALALVLSAVGIYGVVSYSVSQRVQEIGIRMALGAQKWQVVRMVLGEGMLVSSLGIAIGLGLAFFATRLLSSLLFGVEAYDPASFLAVSILLGFVALTASYLPARRALKIDPLTALRQE
jgi:putative ABC transport system permease protein